MAEETRPTEEPDVEAHSIGVDPEGPGADVERSSDDEPDFELHTLGAGVEGPGVDVEGPGVDVE